MFSILLVTSFPIQSVCLLSLALFFFHAVLSAKGQQKLFSFFCPMCYFTFSLNSECAGGKRSKISLFQTGRLFASIQKLRLEGMENNFHTPVSWLLPSLMLSTQQDCGFATVLGLQPFQ